MSGFSGFSPEIITVYVKMGSDFPEFSLHNLSFLFGFDRFFIVFAEKTEKTHNNPA
jgi:hypothetical protein